MADFFAPKPRAGRVAPEPNLGSIPEDAPDETLPRERSDDKLDSKEHVAEARGSELGVAVLAAGARGLPLGGVGVSQTRCSGGHACSEGVSVPRVLLRLPGPPSLHKSGQIHANPDSESVGSARIRVGWLDSAHFYSAASTIPLQ